LPAELVLGRVKFAVVSSGLGLNRAIRRKSVFIRISQLGCEKRPENQPRLSRNQQAAGSIPAGGSRKLCAALPS
jgi:hypothetical protein